jgi:hypothetical protein
MKIDRAILLSKYDEYEGNIYSVADFFHCDHKIIRSYLNKYEIEMKPYQYSKQFHKSFVEPSLTNLLSKNSVLAHTIYLSEGWHTDKTNELVLTNQNVNLIKIFSECLFQTYRYDKSISIVCYFNYNDVSVEELNQYKILFSDMKKYSFYQVNELTRKNIIFKAKAGGKNLANLFIDNAYKILTI